MARVWIYRDFFWQLKMVWLDCQGHGRNTIGRWVTVKSVEGVCGWTSLRIGTNCEDVYIPCECPKEFHCREGSSSGRQNDVLWR